MMVRRICPSCKRPRDVHREIIENFLERGVDPPPSRATKEELQQWIDKHTDLLVDLRAILLDVYATQIAARVEYRKDVANP